MRHLFAAAAVYAGLVADVALNGALLAGCAPSCLLLAGTTAGRQPGALLWAAIAGLMCDCMTGRPIGVTAFSAGMTVALLRAVRPTRAALPSRTVEVFAAITVIQVASNAMSLFGEVSAGTATLLLSAFRTAASTAALFLLGCLLFGTARFISDRIRGSARRASRFTEPARA